MKKAVTVFVILTPVAFLVWALAFCLSGIVGGNVEAFLPYIKDMFLSFKTLLVAPFTEIYKLIAYVFLGFIGLGLLFYFILPPVKKRFGYMWHVLLMLVASVPMLVSIVNLDYYKETLQMITFQTDMGLYILIAFQLGAALLTTVFMFVLWLLTFIDICKNKGRKSLGKIPNVDEYGVEVPMAPVIGANGLSSKAIPASEPVPGEEKREDPLLSDIRRIVKEELAKMASSLQARQNVVDRMVIESIRADQIKEKPVPVDEVIDEAEPALILEEPEEINDMEDELIQVGQQSSTKQEQSQEQLKEPIVEEIKLDEAIVEEVDPDEFVKEEPISEDVIVDDKPNFEDEPSPEDEEVASENGFVTEEVKEAEENEDAVPVEQEVANEVKQDEQVQETVETFEQEPEPLTTQESEPAQFEQEPVPEEVEKIEETILAPVTEEVKPTYERISFMDRMINAEPEMKEHYNILKNIILSYGVKSRVSNSGDAFRLHTKTYVKLTIAGKSLKLYFALDPKDYENTTLPFQNVGNKGIYAEIPLAFKVKSDLSMKRAKELIAQAMAKDNLEQGEIGEIDYVEQLKNEVAEQDSEEE